MPEGDPPDETSATAAAAKTATRKPPALDITLESSVQGMAAWTVFELGFGALLIWSLGTVGAWVGVVMIVHGAFRLAELISLLAGSPGRLVVGDRVVRLPRGRTAARSFEVAPADVTAAYFLRRSVPWNHAAPVLVVELGHHALTYPRDWFGSEADQRHAIHALLSGIAPSGGAPSPATTAALETARRLETTKLGVGVVLFVAGVAAWVLTSAPVATSMLHVLYVAPIMAGVTLVWRWLTRL